MKGITYHGEAVGDNAKIHLEKEQNQITKNTEQYGVFHIVKRIFFFG